MQQTVQGSSLLLAYYGDDFTGSTDSLEALTLAGLRTVLFLRCPDPVLLRTRFPNLQCFGVAGVTRSMTPSALATELSTGLSQLRQTQAPIIHYKVCSTFDSSPAIGSIGKAIDVGKVLFHTQRTIPLLVGAPALRRYTVFGNHFAAMWKDIYRLDRHPIMSKHPVTPMDEADLRCLLRRQTDSIVALMSVLDLEGSVEAVEERFDRLVVNSPDVVLFDVLNEDHMLVIGHLIWREAQSAQQFVVGSSGVEYALTAHWRANGTIPTPAPRFNPVGSAGPLLVVSGSCSAVTQRQIEWAVQHGFVGVRIPVEQYARRHGRYRGAFQEVLEQAVAALNAERNVVLYTALGPDDPRISETCQVLQSAGVPHEAVGETIGRRLGWLTREVVKRTAIRRLLIAGGDTAGYTVRELDIDGLEMSMPIAPGSPLCVIHAADSRYDGLQVALKGGQVGGEDYFGRVQMGLCE
ncbi:MAG: four-carbon acid sugar kinase family protein [Alicyclobacillus macrosporangiidus]|uniref:four-carbon acid sugar kinase family protein n=1 Tax=Alicyclobacillus macrosporangiidus TaxID=392015 RepID=UPI0026E9E386|nr:four-carbon acid sugar kinase family protein [Alicyclobacillus macrosporangiidus]MCL6597598.1 four-carbon acid sugar kinase family protein [Alicyclobacillus macrosporangiidus]